MANATTSSPIGRDLPAQSPQVNRPPKVHPATQPSTPSGKPFGAPESRAARAAAQAKRQQWAALNLRQQWADEDFMRGHLRVAGIRITVNSEPATTTRVKAKLREVGVHSPEAQAAVGMSLPKWLAANPRLPLWAALALVLEGTGRFSPDDTSIEPEAVAPPLLVRGKLLLAASHVGRIDVPMTSHRRPFVAPSVDLEGGRA